MSLPSRSSRSERRLVGGEGVAFISHINGLSKSAGHLSALMRNGYLRPAPHHVRRVLRTNEREPNLN